jgi:hypothetical protein
LKLPAKLAISTKYMIIRNTAKVALSPEHPPPHVTLSEAKGLPIHEPGRCFASLSMTETPTA